MTLLVVSVAAFYLMFCAVISTAVIEDGQSASTVVLPDVDSSLQRIVSVEQAPALADTVLMPNLSNGLPGLRAALANMTAAVDTVKDSTARQYVREGSDYSLLKDLPNGYDRMRQLLKKQIQDYNGRAVALPLSAKSLRSLLQSRMLSAAGLSNLAKQNYYQTLILYYQNDVTLRSRNLAAVRENLESAAADLESQLQGATAEINSLAEKAAKGQSFYIPSYGSLMPSGISERLFSTSWIEPDQSYIPPPDRSGSDYAWLGVMANWLSSPRNMDLVLIIGMIGFGLFGASISSFIAKSSGMNKSTSISEDIIQVLISGFSAAIVVFLATKGGIAIINQGTNKPNPYVLFFSCLAGAVFSDRIWEWAKGVINRNYNADGTISTQTTTAQTTTVVVQEQQQTAQTTPPVAPGDETTED